MQVSVYLLLGKCILLKTVTSDAVLELHCLIILEAKSDRVRTHICMKPLQPG